jgi:hypothetical protein
MPLNREISSLDSIIELEDIRRFYFEHTKQTLRIEDAKYLLERAEELKIDKRNGGLEALFRTLKYDFEDQDNFEAEA